MRFSDFHTISKGLVILGTILLVIVLILWALCIMGFNINIQSNLLFYLIIIGFVSCLCIGVALCYELMHYWKK